MKMRWLPEKYKLIGLVASDDDTRNQLTWRFVIVICSYWGKATSLITNLGEGGPSSCVISVGIWVVHIGVSIVH